MRVLARVLLGLGVFLLIAGVLAVTWVPGVAKRTPLDVDTRTVYEGEAAKLDTATGAFDKLPVFAVQTTQADSKRSSDDHVLMVENSCLVFDTGESRVCPDGEGDDTDPNLITYDVDIFAEDRVTAVAVEDKNLPDDAGPHEGLINKWPFDAEKKTYPYWDGTAGHTVDMVYQGTEDIGGLSTYRFQSVISEEAIDAVVSDDPETTDDESLPGTYSNKVTVNIDPKTGAIVKGAQDQQRWLDDGTQILDVQVGWTDDTIDKAVDDAKTNGLLLTLLLTVLPIVGFAGGALCLIGGGFLLMRDRDEGDPQPASNKEKVGAGA